MSRYIMRAILMALCLLFAAQAKAEPFEIAVLMAIDVSASVTQDRFELQKGGIIGALRSERIKAAINGRHTWIGIMEWSDVGQQKLIIEKAVDKPDDLEEIATAYEEHGRSFASSTAIGDAIVFAMVKLDEVEAHKKVIDVSGDGKNNGGPFELSVIEDAEAKGITINGLPIMGNEPDVVEYYAEHVKTSDGFIIEAKSFSDVFRAMEQKLFQEVSYRVIP